MTDRILSTGRFLTRPTQDTGPDIMVRLADRVLGLSTLDSLYRLHDLGGQPPVEFVRNSLQALDIQIDGAQTLLERLPAYGPGLILLNHPLGGAEGLSLASILLAARPDVKILTNQILATIPELAPAFIGTNPLRSNAPGNRQALIRCRRHLESGGLLVLFPAGRVSFRQPGRRTICDQQWHRFVASLEQSGDVPVLPVFVSGRNSRLFYTLGRVHPDMRPLLLARELLKARGSTVRFHPGRLCTGVPPHGDPQARTDHYRLLTYLHDPSLPKQWPGSATPPQEPLPVADAQSAHQLQQEIDQLPGHQRLLAAGSCEVCYVQRHQAPAIIEEIRRLRELTFRDLDEGSGQPADGDAFDDTYTHLFLYDRAQQRITGAYRMGRTDRLMAQRGPEGLYLSRMFEFPDHFINRQYPCLEMGRSFLVTDMQRSYQGLQLLFRGIMAFVIRHPAYRYLYGTVSLSRQYKPLSAALIERFLVETPRHGNAVRPLDRLDYPYSEEVDAFVTRWQPGLESLDWFIRRLEDDGKGVPVLLRQYHRLGARFHALGIDPNFASTPGLLLSVDMQRLPDRIRKRFSRGLEERGTATEAPA